MYACGAVTNLADYFYGGGEGWILGGCYLAILVGKLIKGVKICANKVMDKPTTCLCYKVKKGCQVTICLARKGLPADGHSSKKVDVVSLLGCKDATKIRLCCLMTTL